MAENILGQSETQLLSKPFHQAAWWFSQVGTGGIRTVQPSLQDRLNGNTAPPTNLGFASGDGDGVLVQIDLRPSESVQFGVANTGEQSDGYYRPQWLELWQVQHLHQGSALVQRLELCIGHH